MAKIVELTLAQVMQPFQANLSGNVHGGEIMKMMDIMAGSVATKYAKGTVVTARVDEIQFILPSVVGDYVSMTGRLVYVGNTSMEILVTVDVEDLRSDTLPQRALSASFTMVALDQRGRPKTLPPLDLETDEDRQLFAAAQSRRELSRKNRA